MADNSLLPYLGGSGSAFSLEFSPRTDDPAAGAFSRFPFDVISDAGVLTRIFGASVVSDAGSLIKPVFLMSSRDDYAHLENTSNELTNSDVEMIWERAFRNHKKRGFLIELSAKGSGDEGGNLFRSLFFCSKTRVFFHPACPRCGQELELCRDDAVLTESGLKPYSSSLKRYLFCPSCYDAGTGKEFYAKTPGDADPVAVKSPNDLIQAFEGLNEGDVPCVNCPERKSCFEKGEASSVIVPICFYPFHLIIFEAATLNASDFLSLVSGAPCSELEKLTAGERQSLRSRCISRFQDTTGAHTLFAGEERQFLEILYLKLSFLQEVSSHIMSGDGDFSSFEAGTSLQGLWLRIPEQSSLLPCFWSFRVAAMDMDLQAPGIVPLQGPGYASRVLGMLWFHALLKNRVQDVRAVNEGINRMLKEKRIDENDTVFGSHNNFWEPKPVPRRWASLWTRALDLGLALLGEAGNPGDSRDDILKTCRTLRDEVRKELFDAAPEADAPLAVQKEAGKGDEQIGLILGNIASRWKPASRAPEEAGPAEPEAAEEQTAGSSPSEAEATVVIFKEEFTISPEAEKDIPEILAAKIPPQQQSTPGAEEDDFKNETVILRNIPDIPPAEELEPIGRAADAPHEPARETTQDKEEAPAPAHYDPEATVIMGTPRTNAGPGQQAKPSIRDDAEATIIMGTPGQSTPVQPAAGSPQYDDPEATIIMSPDKKR